MHFTGQAMLNNCKDKGGKIRKNSRVHIYQAVYGHRQCSPTGPTTIIFKTALKRDYTC